MSYALIEVEATSKKAARGAGYSWGMAEEAAKASRWLCANGLDGVGVLARVLESADGADLARHAPHSFAGDWRAETGEMCPLMAGAALADTAAFWSKSDKRIGSVIAPVMLLPFAAMSARALGISVTVKWAGSQATTDGTVTSLEVGESGGLLDLANEVTVQTGGTVGTPLAEARRAMPSEADWILLNTYAHRTYAPDTEASRLRGAGAGLNDND